MFRRNVDIFDGCALFSFFRRMEKKFDIPPVRVATHPEANDRIAIGFIDGSIGFYNFDVSKDALKV